MNQIEKRLKSIYDGYFTAQGLKAKALIDGGYYQVSRKFRTLARLPKGMTGKQALLNVVKEFQHEWVECLGEASAGDYYLRCHSLDKIEIGESLFRTFRFLGGNTYQTAYYEKEEMETVKNG